MKTWHWVVIAWVAFDVLIYLWAWADNYFYSHDVKGKMRKFKQIITEE
ncbi:MAG: hypothetical protein IJZ01_05780 [Paraprevotella sp.]|nr:hypothetical protein [Paraprevotella sp.]MBQ8283054.1 hypothetical protein [Paraprevotella sp.]